MPSVRASIPPLAFENAERLVPLIGGSLVGLVMIAMIGKGVTSGIATSTEVSAFAVAYALIVGGLAFRELSARSVLRLFVRSASMAGSILFIVAAASSVSFALTIQQIPQQLSGFMMELGHRFGADGFVLASTLLMIAFGAILEGAPALIIFGPLLTPIALQLGVSPLHFGTVMVVAMGSWTVFAAGRTGLVRDLLDHRYRVEGRRPADGEVSRRPVRRAAGARVRAGVFAVASRAVRLRLITSPGRLSEVSAIGFLQEVVAIDRLQAHVERRPFARQRQRNFRAGGAQSRQISAEQVRQR